jgi:hypothetical protein
MSPMRRYAIDSILEHPELSHKMSRSLNPLPRREGCTVFYCPASILTSTSGYTDAKFFCHGIINSHSWKKMSLSPLSSSSIPGGELVVSYLFVASTSFETFTGPNSALSTKTSIGPYTISSPVTIFVPATPGYIPSSSPSSSTGPITTSSESGSSGSNSPTTSPTSTTSSTSSTCPTRSVAPPKGVPAGTVAGVAVGTAVAGAFIALLVAWIFFRRPPRSRRGVETSWASNADHQGSFGSPKYKDNSNGKGVTTSIIALEDIPLDPADDSQIRKSMQDLYELIHQHVENHYSTENFQGRVEDLRQELAKCGWSDQTEPSAPTLATLLINPITRRVAIRHIIAWVILQHVDLKSSPETSLLPTHILATSQAIIRIKRTPGEQAGTRLHSYSTQILTKADSMTTLAFSSSFTKWRHFTASLLSPLSSRPDNLESDSNLRPAVLRNVKRLHSILRPFIKSGPEAQLTNSDNLSSVILEVAHFGMVLFSQPTVWIFKWDGKDLNRGGRSGQRFGTGNGSVNTFLVVFPSIGKVVARDGKEQFRVVADAMFERI